jgi:hypothetical protein
MRSKFGDEDIEARRNSLESFVIEAALSLCHEPDRQQVFAREITQRVNHIYLAALRFRLAAGIFSRGMQIAERQPGARGCVGKFG